MSIVIKNLVRKFKSENGTITAVDIEDFSFNDTGLYVIIGKTGCGKTTLLNMIGNFLEPTSGEILVDSVSLTKSSASLKDNFRRVCISSIFQNVSILDLVADFSLVENMEIASYLQNRKIDDEKKKIDLLLSFFGIEKMKNKKVSDLSGGQIQRGSISRALLRRPDIIIADEPTSSLDPETKKIVIDTLKEVSKNRLVILVTHDMALLEKADYIMGMEDGKIKKFEEKSNFFSKNESIKTLFLDEEVKQKTFFKEFMKDENKEKNIEDDNQEKNSKEEFLNDVLEKQEEIRNKENNNKEDNILNKNMDGIVVVNSIFSSEEKKDITVTVNPYIPLRYMIRIGLNNVCRRPIRTIFEIFVHFFIFAILSGILLFLFYISSNAPELRKQQIVNFESEIIGVIIKVFKILITVVIAFSIFMSSRSIYTVIKKNKQQIAILRSIGASSFNIFLIYFLEFASLLLVSFVISESLLIFQVGNYISFSKNIVIFISMLAYWFLTSVVSVIIPVILITRKSISEILKKD